MLDRSEVSIDTRLGGICLILLLPREMVEAGPAFVAINQQAALTLIRKHGVQYRNSRRSRDLAISNKNPLN